MKSKKIKKLKHNRKVKVYRKKQLVYEKDPLTAEMLNLANDIKKEKIWQMPYVERGQIEDATDEKTTIDDICNYVRTQTTPFTLNWSAHTEEKERQRLKPIAEKHEIVRWQVFVSNVSVVNVDGKHQGFILWDKVVRLNPKSKDVYIGFRRSVMDNLLDYHMWLPIDRILYFGNKDVQEMV